jgi:hypothetical protein
VFTQKQWLVGIRSLGSRAIASSSRLPAGHDAIFQARLAQERGDKWEGGGLVVPVLMSSTEKWSSVTSPRELRLYKGTNKIKSKSNKIRYCKINIEFVIV